MNFLINVLRGLRCRGWLAVGGLFRLLRQFGEPGANGEYPRKIRIVFVNTIGDFVLFSGVLNDLSRTYPDHHFELVGLKRWLDLAENCPHFSRIISFNRNRFIGSTLYRFKILWEVAEGKSEMLLYPAYSRTPFGDMIVAASRAEAKVAYHGNLDNISATEMRIGNRMYSRLLRLPETGVLREFEAISNFILELGVQPEAPLSPAVWISDDNYRTATQLLIDSAVGADEKYVVFAVTPSTPKKMWPEQNYLPVLKWLEQQHYTVIFSGAPNQDVYFDRLRKSTHAKVVNLVGKTSLPVLAAIMEKAQLYVGVDTASLHIATAVDTPAICIMGGGQFQRFYPYGDANRNRMVYHQLDCFNCNWVCIHDSVRCMEQIQPVQVIKELERMKKNGTLISV